MLHYFDAAYRQQIETLRQRFTARTEWPTWLLLIGVYGGWFPIMLNSDWLGRGWSTLLLIPLLVLNLSVGAVSAMEKAAPGVESPGAGRGGEQGEWEFVSHF